MEDRIGQQWGNFRLIRLIAKGESTDVYEAEHVHLGVKAAVKIFERLPADQEIRANATRTFLEEARILFEIKHPSIIRALEFGIHQEDTIPYITTEYLPRGNCRSIIPPGASVTAATAAAYIKKLAFPLAFLHENGLVHRDIKPENILIGDNDELILSHFGTSTFGESQDMNASGSYPYRSPEQFSGESDHRSDIYSLGILTYEWLTGHVPFFVPSGSGLTGKAYAIKHSKEKLSKAECSLVKIPSSIEAVIMKALAKNPDERFQTVQEYLAALEYAVQAHKQQENKYEQPHDTVRTRHHHISRKLLAVLVALIGILLAGIVARNFIDQHSEPSNIQRQLMSTPTPTLIRRPTQVGTAFTNHASIITSVDWSKDGKYLVSTSADGTILVWTPSGQIVRTVHIPQNEHPVSWWAPAGRSIATVTNKGVRIWDASTGLVQHTISLTATASPIAAWSTDGKYIAIGGIHAVIIITTTTWQTINIPVLPEKLLTALSWSPDSQFLAFGGTDQVLSIWNNITGHISYLQLYIAGSVRSLSWSADGEKIAIGSTEGILCIWEVGINTEYGEFNPHIGSINVVAWSKKNESLLAFSGADATVHILNVTTKKTVSLSMSSYGRITSLSWSPDSQFIASGWTGKTVFIWRVIDSK